MNSQIGVVYENPTQFPAVTLCDCNPFTTEEGQNFVLSFNNSTDCQKSRDKVRCVFNLASSKASETSFGDEKRKKNNVFIAAQIVKMISIGTGHICLAIAFSLMLA